MGSWGQTLCPVLPPPSHTILAPEDKAGVTEPISQMGKLGISSRTGMQLSKTKITPGVRRDVGGRKEILAETLGVLLG